MSRFSCNCIRTSQNITFCVSDFELNSIRENSIAFIIVPMVIGTSHYIAIIFNNLDIFCNTLLANHTDCKIYIIVSNIDITILRFMHCEGN